MTDELKTRLLAFIERGESLHGRTLHIHEAISTNQQNFDRHFTTFARTDLVLTRFGGRISGARLMFESENQYYEISADRIIRFTEQAHELEFVEQYSETVYRKTTITIR